MLQAILIEPRRIELRDVPIKGPSSGEVIIKIHTALTCGTDLKAYLRGHPLIPMPGPFGHEYSGYVAKTGKGVKGFKEGDAVMGVHSAPCLVCRYCKKRLFNLCDNIMKTKALGAFAEYLLLPANVVKHNLYHKPDEIGFSESALLEPLSCVIHPFRRMKMAGIENALVMGTGAIGLMHIAYLRMRGIRVFATDVSMERLFIAEGLGARIIMHGDNIKDLIMEETDGMGFDLVIECTGKEDVWQECINYPRRGGMVILFGGCPKGSRVCYDTHRLHYDELTLYGSFHYTPADVKMAYDILTEKRLHLAPIISGGFHLNEITSAFNLLKDGKGIKYAITP
ncbi:MAG: alcohol dehydrogenase catalytic domain-containing protein [Thermodesulfovibrionia bacterium]